MAMRTITRMYDHHDTAVEAIQALESAGIAHDQISMVGADRDNRYAGTGPLAGAPAGTSAGTTATGTTASGAETGAGTGASIGTILGGGAGLLAGIGALAIPGVGPVVAAGWLIATLTGAGVGAAVGGGAGGLLGSLTGAGVPERDAHVYAEGVRRGSTLVTVRAEEVQAVQAEGILARFAAVDPTARRAEYEQGGWTAFDTNAPSYTQTDAEAARANRPAIL